MLRLAAGVMENLAGETGETGEWNAGLQAKSGYFGNFFILFGEFRKSYLQI